MAVFAPIPSASVRSARQRTPVAERVRATRISSRASSGKEYHPGHWVASRFVTSDAQATRYMHDGVQYIVVAVGKREHSAKLVALRLP